MNLLVTGANGFIGRALCKKMLADGWQVRVAVRGATQMTALSSRVEGMQVGDIGPDTDWSKALNGVDAVVHLAARVHVMDDSASDSLVAFRWVNVKGTERLAQQAVAANVRRFFFMSSVKANGEERAQPYTERDMPMPLDPYGISKWEAEQKLHKVAKETGMELVVLRPPLVYGPGVKANFLRLLKVVDRGIPLPFANVNNLRSLIYLENLLDALVACITHPKAAGQTFLVSDNMDLSTPELIRLMVEAMGRKARLFSFPPRMLKIIGKITGRSSEIHRLIESLCVDSSKIRTMLGWNPPYTPEEGIRKTVLWYKKYGKGQRTDVRW
jgi:nucleoside-diphosphate-sugar epimerase